MPSEKPITFDKAPSGAPDSLRDELARRNYHLNTLYDMSRNIFGIVEIETILKNFLLMTTGNFGVIEGFILTQRRPSQEITHFVSRGFRDDENAFLCDGCKSFLGVWNEEENFLDSPELKDFWNGSQTVTCAFPFKVNESHWGLLGLGTKIIGEPYSDDDKNLLTTLINHLTLSLRNALAFEDVRKLNLEMKEKNDQLEKAFEDIDRRVYHLKTLYDVSKDIFGSVNFKGILREFLMTAMGNFGVIEGFILTLDPTSGETSHLESIGFQEESNVTLEGAAKKILIDGDAGGPDENIDCITNAGLLPSKVECALPFTITSERLGLLGLGSKLIGEPYSEDDKELLITLVNSLVVALKNAKSFEDIKRLNMDLQEKNAQLEKALRELQAALRKVEILESIKANLSKFVPTTVTKLIETDSPFENLEACEKDISVMFLDIEGYTVITEKLGASEVNKLVERCFSVFMDAIYENNGDVVETSGDGLMVLFMSEDGRMNALEAVKSAAMIKDKTLLLQKEAVGLSQPLKVNVGISSGKSVVGANKFESYTGSRWVYTCHGTAINVAARICSHAKGGTVMISKETAERVKGHFSFSSVGEFSLKNLSEKVEIFEMN